MSDRIRPAHLDRKAILYVRQSSHYQVMHNEESRRLQYGMKSRLQTLGWQTIDVIDEDLGVTATGTAVRTGFDRMVAEVCMGEIGAVAARELSRFARNSREWQHLIEVCRVVDTILLDQETIYDARRGNDRLLLGLKGSLNEYELDILRMRSLEARYKKAERGELLIIAPVGYLKTADQRLEKDPDRRVQEAIQLVFSKFFELGTVRQTLCWFLGQEVKLPSIRQTPEGWKTRWGRPSYSTVMRILRDPAYAGIYAYGKTKVEHHFENGVLRKRIRRQAREDWRVEIPDHHEPYISREEFERVQTMIDCNIIVGKGDTGGAPRRGAALLSGLLRCRRCGRKLTVTYTGQKREFLRYACHRGHLDCGEPRCISFGGTNVDEAVSEEVLRVVEPAALDAATQAHTEAQARQQDIRKTLDLEWQQAHYEAERTRRQYDAVEPENRLVAEELERRWNAAMERESALQERLHEQTAICEAGSRNCLADFRSLAKDLAAVWYDEKADVRQKKRIIRIVIEEILVDMDAKAGKILLVIHWKGGIHTEKHVRWRKRGQNRCHTSPDIVAAVIDMALVCTDDLIASYLNRNHLQTGRGNRWTQERVTSLRSKRKIPRFSPERKEQEGWMNLTEAAKYLGVSARTLRLAVEQGRIPAKHPLPEAPWIFNRQDLDGDAGKQVVAQADRKKNKVAIPDPDQATLF